MVYIAWCGIYINTCDLVGLSVWFYRSFMILMVLSVWFYLLSTTVLVLSDCLYLGISVLDGFIQFEFCFYELLFELPTSRLLFARRMFPRV